MPDIATVNVLINSVGATATVGVLLLFWRFDRRLVRLETLVTLLMKERDHA